ncbi:NAD(P)-dependent oxidoreductase [Candidatus Pacearchaeota archaeon]|nr:NAD(P)-dependent oxidoreductase [Candidatus Pacearchaeota archaeon]
MQKVLITGGAGYLGSFLAGYLLEKGFNVTCLDNLSYKQRSLLHYASNPRFNFIYGDARNKELLVEILPEFDVIIPLAAIVGMPACDAKPLDAVSINYEAIVLINELRTSRQKLIYPTTNSGYGTKTGDVFCTEETPLEPISLYGRTKSDAERYLLAAAKSGKDVITLRLATVFGISPRMRTDLLVNDFVLKALRDGYVVIYEAHFKRNYIHIRDVARCFEHCIVNFDSMKNQIYNVGLEDANLSKMELAETIKKYVPKFAMIPMKIGEDPDKRNYIVSNKKIMATGFLPAVSLEDGIQELMRGYALLLKDDPYKNA